MAEPRSNLAGWMPQREDQKRLVQQSDAARALDDQRKRAGREPKPPASFADFQAGFHSPSRG